MKKRILILTDEVAPPAFAPRINSLVRLLYAEGFTATIFCDRLPGVAPFSAEHGEWYQTAYYGDRQKHSDYLADKLCNKRERDFRRFVRQKTDVSTYDAVFCSTCYYFPLQTALHLASKYNLPLVVDMRDIAEQWGNVPYMTYKSTMPRWLTQLAQRSFVRWNIYKRNNVLRKADAVITISGWHQRLLSNINRRTLLVYNGYDTNEFYPLDVKTDKFRICYAGKLYNINFRDPRLLFQAMRQLIASGQICPEDVEIVFHIDEPSIATLQRLVEEYGIAHICKISGYITKQQLYELLHQSSVALVLTCLSTTDGPHGILGTKFYEALGVEKPVLCVRSDEDALAEVIRMTNAGVAAANADEAMTFLLDKYREWKQHGFTRQPVDREKKQLFSREVESAQILQIIKDAR